MIIPFVFIDKLLTILGKYSKSWTQFRLPSSLGHLGALPKDFLQIANYIPHIQSLMQDSGSYPENTKMNKSQSPLFNIHCMETFGYFYQSKEMNVPNPNS